MSPSSSSVDLVSCCLYNPLTPLLLLSSSSSSSSNFTSSSSVASSIAPLRVSDLPPSSLLLSLMSDTDRSANTVAINYVNQIIVILFLFLSIGAAVADFPQLVTVLYHGDASGLSLTALCSKIFSLSICFTKLSLQTMMAFTTFSSTGSFQQETQAPSLSFPDLEDVRSVFFATSASPATQTQEHQFGRMILLLTTFSAGIALLENLLLLITISIFNKPRSKWPKFSLFVLMMTALCSTLMILSGAGVVVSSSSHDYKKYHHLVHKVFLGEMLGLEGFADESTTFFSLLQEWKKPLAMFIESFAFACCCLSPCWSWYFNYKHKATRRFSKVSQMMHSVVCALGILMTYLYFFSGDMSSFPDKAPESKLTRVMQNFGISSSSSSSTKYLTLAVGVWHLFFHLVMVLQVVESDRVDARMSIRRKVFMTTKTTTAGSSSADQLHHAESKKKK